MPSSILDRRLILVAGKGGVGRSTVAAAIARACAARGRTTLLYQASAKDRFGALFGRAPVGTEIVPLADNLMAPFRWERVVRSAQAADGAPSTR